MIPFPITRNSSRAKQPLWVSCKNVTGLLGWLQDFFQIKIENICLYKLINKSTETSLKNCFAQIFSCCPKNLSCPKFGGAAALLAPPARTPMTWHIAYGPQMEDFLFIWFSNEIAHGAIQVIWWFSISAISVTDLVEPSPQTREQMTEFWNKHSTAQSVEEMMLDSKAEVLTQHEQPEVLGMLPSVKEKDVLELGAGIG